MIKKLRLRFTIICMSILTIIFFVMIIVINSLNYRQVEVYADEIIDILAVDGGKFGDSFHPDKEPFLGPEVKYDTRFFVVEFDDYLNPVIVNVQNVASVSREEAVEMSLEAITNDETRGFSDEFRYMVKKNIIGTQVIFVDCSKQIFFARLFVNTSVIVVIIALVALSALVWYLTKKVVRPISESYEKQKKFITDAGHELRTPLTIISANAEIIELENGENECIDVIKKQVKRMSEMTKNLVMLSKIDEKEAIQEFNNFNLSDALIDVQANFKKNISKENKELSYDIEEKIYLNGNEKLIRQLLHLLYDNAIKYSISKVYVKLEQNKNKVILEMSNDCEKINESEIKNYFNRFYRTESSRASNIDGSGIGLSIVKEIVDLHKGDVKIYSSEKYEYNIKINL